MQRKRLGTTGLEVSEIGFGGIPIIPLSPAEAVAVIRRCFELGITFFDTANMYPTSEEKLGAALEPVRSAVVIATKTAARDAAGAAAHIDLSLRLLRTDWIDIFQLHNLSNAAALEQALAPDGAYAAAARAREAGKVRVIGFSSHSPAIAVQALATGLFATVQFPFNFIEVDPLEELLPLAVARGAGIIGMKPLGGGLLERADLCFKFLRQYPEVVPIPGIRAAREAEEIVALLGDPQPLSEADREAIAAIRTALGDRFCRRCEYCMPCEQGVQISHVLMLKPALRRLSPEGVRGWIGKAMETVAQCAACGACVERCPYGLPIPDLLKENLALYTQAVRGQPGGGEAPPAA